VSPYMKAEADPTLLSMAETCRRLRYSRWTVRKLIRLGELQAVKGSARNSPIRVFEHSVRGYLARNQISPTAPASEGAA
jgi:Helix-turn-helix domain